MLKITTPPSGLRVATYKIDRQMCGIVVIIGAGSRFEKKIEKGFSHFLEHMLMAGTKTYPRAIDLQDAVESIGGSRNAHTAREYVTFEVDILKEHLDFALKTLAEQLQESVFDSSEIDKQKIIIGDELEREKVSQSEYIARKINDLLWPGQSLEWSIDIEEKNIKSATKKSLTEFLKLHYTAPNTLISIAGDIDHAEYASKIEELFSKLPTTKASGFPVAIENKSIVTKLEPKGLKRIHLALGFYAPSRRHKSRLAAMLLSSILSRELRTRLRYELGLTYHTSVKYTTLEDTGSFVIKGSFSPDVTQRAIDEIFKVISSIKSGSITADSLKRSLSQNKTGSIRTSESVGSLADAYAFRSFYNYEPILIQDEVKLMENVTAKEIQEVANNYLSDSYKILMTGPKEQLAELEKLYGQKQAE